MVEQIHDIQSCSVMKGKGTSKVATIRVGINAEVHPFLYEHLLSNVPSRKKWADAILILASIGLTASRISLECNRRHVGQSDDATFPNNSAQSSDGLCGISGTSHALTPMSDKPIPEGSISAGSLGSGNTTTIPAGIPNIDLAPDDVAEMGSLFSG